MTKTMTTFKALASINVKDKIEKKGRFDYLSWAYAWAIIKDKYPDANRKVYESDHTGLNYFTDGNTAYVKVGVTVGGVEHIDYLPIMNHQNRSIKVESVTSFDVNKAIQRSMVKAIGMHGLGLSLWAGEDLVDVSEEKPPVKKSVKPSLKKTHKNWADCVSYIKSNKTVPFAQLIKNLEERFTIPASNKKELNSYYAN
tara:strand:- start:446 stop:1039 length:594 start_codon:yes stop_codon:yes gene_type:complete